MTSHLSADARPPDAIELLVQDHRKVGALFNEYEELTGDAPDRKRRIVDDLIHELSVHAAIEEELLYPFIRDEVPGGDKLADEGLHEHQQVKELLVDLEGLEPHDARFDQKVASLIKDVRHHVEEEENQLFPRLRETVGDEQIVELGLRLETAKKTAPTRPTG